MRLLIIPNRLDISTGAISRLSLPGIIKRLTQLWREQAGLAVTYACPMKLHQAKPDYGRYISTQQAFTRRMP